MNKVACPVNYYLGVFKQRNELSKSGFNWFAAIFGPFWALRKKMYSLALIISVSFFVSGNLAFSLVILYRRFTQKTDDYNILMPHIQHAAHTFLWALCIWAVYQLISTFLYGRYGNQLYYKHVKGKISQGYHLVDSVSPTLSLWSIILVLSGPAMVLPFIVSASIVLLRVLRVKFVEAFLVISILFLILFAIGEFLYYKADALAVKKFKKQHECLDIQVSEKNIQRYLVAKGNNTYLKAVDWMIFSGIVLYVGFILYLIFCYQLPSQCGAQECHEKICDEREST